jgi:hypothetical protein
MSTELSQAEDHGRQTLEEMLSTDEAWAQPRARAEEQADAEAPARPSGKARVGFILGLVSLPFSLIPILGVILGSVAMDLGIRARREPDTANGRATTAIVLGAVGAVLSIAFFVFGIVRQ